MMIMMMKANNKTVQNKPKPLASKLSSKQTELKRQEAASL